ncbi:MAG: class I SAM-dependent methyltransferase [Planctomycetes bacterium]|nr:class I SAM-dependent methyltransferase [Planctomycetota bacterium]
MTKSDYSQIARNQCEKTAKIYYSYRKKKVTGNDIIEIPAMRKLIGDVSGKKLLDAGCGFGTHSVYCAKMGADVTAVDISQTMINIARQEAETAGVKIDFKVMDATKMDSIEANTFDIVISSVAMCFGIQEFLNETARVLKPSGVFCFSDAHPFTGAGRKVKEENGFKLVVDDYLTKGLKKHNNVFGKIDPSDEDYEWQWEHSTLEDYCLALNRAGFLIETLLEPKPEPETKDLNPTLYDFASKYPVFVLIRAIKK